MQHAFVWIPKSRRLGVFAWVAIVTVVYAAFLSRQGAPLKVPDAPAGIVSFELAGNAVTAQRILSAWQPLGDVAQRQLMYDFGYLLLYPVLFGMACALLSEVRASLFPRLGALLSWIVLLAAPFDATENTLLLRMLSNGASESLAAFAALSASIKFVLLTIALVYIVVQGTWTLTHRRSLASPP